MAIMMQETVYRIPAPVDVDFAFLVDSHNAKADRILRSLREHRPGAIVIAGDLLIGYRSKKDDLIVREQKNVLRLVSGCAEIAPTYLSFGNHEWTVTPEDIALLSSAGAVVLNNGFVTRTLQNGGSAQRLVLGGLTSAIVTDFQKFKREGDPETDLYPYRKKNAHAARLTTDSAWLTAFEQQQGYKILLCHHPEYYSLREPYLCCRKIDLVLSGHAHGGQVRLFGRGLYSPGQGLFPQFTGGLYDGRLVVSRGLSNTALTPRAFNPTELVYIRLGDG